MKIALAQIKSEMGDVEANLTHHLQIVEQAASLNADLIIFPELSLTGYAPEHAQELAMELGDPQLTRFVEASAKYQLTIGVGIPVKTTGKPLIGLALFEPNDSVNLYEKHYLHADELSTFSSGENYSGCIGNSEELALAICYEISIEAHALKAKNRGAAVYLASVAKTRSGVINASARLAKISHEHQMVSLMCNCVGTCEGQEAGGRSGVWNSQGELLCQLNEHDQGLLLYDVRKNTCTSHCG